MKLKTLLVLPIAFSLAGCAGTASPAATVTVTETVTASPTAEDVAAEPAADEATSDGAPADGVYGVGDAVKNYGAELTVKKAYLAKTVPLNKSGYRAGSGYETYTDEKPDKGR